MTDCSRCGDCCDKIWLGWNLEDLRVKASLAFGLPDPRTEREAFDAEWARRYRTAATDEQVAMLVSNRLDAEILPMIWEEIDHDAELGRTRMRCRMFDEELRECMAHEDRPPVCRGFPFYGKDPAAAVLPPRCSFNADVPGRLLPIASVNGR